MAKKEGNGHAFILMNLKELDDVPYSETVAAEPILLEIIGDNVQVYLDGELIPTEKDENGYYPVYVGVGQALFVTVD
jgi:hypothetical protein